MSSKSLLDHFSALTDPRQSWKVVYPLPEILLTILCGTMAGAEDFVEIKRWAERKLDFLRRILPFEDGVPSHVILNDVMNALPATLFSECSPLGSPVCGTATLTLSPSTVRRPAGRATVTKPRSIPSQPGRAVSA